MQPDFLHTTRSMRLDRGPAAVVFTVAAGLMVLWGAWLGFGELTLYESASAARIENRGTVRLRAAATAEVTRVAVHLGEHVEQGQVLLQLRDDELVAQLAAVDAELASLQVQRRRHDLALVSAQDGRDAGLQAASAAIGQARAAYEEAQVHTRTATERVRGLESLAKSGAVSRAELRVATADLQALQAREEAALRALRFAEQERSRGAATGETDAHRDIGSLAALDAQIAAAHAEQQRLLGLQEQRTVRAPVTGTLGELARVVPGQQVSAGMLLAIVVPNSEPTVVAGFAPERAIGRIQPGQEATVQIRGAAGGLLGARRAVVERVGSEPDLQGQIPVELSLQQATGVSHGLIAEVDVAVEQLSPVALVIRASGGGS